MSADLSSVTTFKTRAFADKLLIVDRLEQLSILPEQLQAQSVLILGGGSNVLFAKDYHGTVLVNRLQGLTIKDNGETVKIRAGAGLIWHDFVVNMSGQGFFGLENLALIPGTVGAAPVQNIGAYGVEVADFIESVSVFDLHNGSYHEFSAADCAFDYRNSVFKHSEMRDRYLITAVTFCLHKTFTPVLSYQDLTANPPPRHAADLLAEIIAIRQHKLPDPDVLPNAGSFFKNPVITREQLASLRHNHPTLPYFTINEQQVKIPAAWLVEQCGFKGKRRDNGAGVYEKHALILVNHLQNGQGANGHEIYALACDIMQAVKTRFAIKLTPEVRVIGG